MRLREINIEYENPLPHEKMEADFDNGSKFNNSAIQGIDIENNITVTENNEKFEKDQEIIARINAKLILKNVAKVTVRKIRDYCPVEYGYVCENIKDVFGNIDWKPVKDGLDDSLQENFNIRKIRTPESAIKELAFNLLRSKIKVCTPKYIEKNQPQIYDFIVRNMRNQEDEIAWAKIAMELTAYGLTLERQDLEYRTCDEAIFQLRAALLEKNPTKFSPKYIENTFPKLYEYFKNNVRNADGKIDWNGIIDALAIRIPFEYIQTLVSVLPKEEYVDEDEMNSVIGENKKYFYTFINVQTREDYAKRNEICEALCLLAQKGNTAAKDELMNNVLFLASNWIDQNPRLQSYKLESENLYKVIERCIYMYQMKGSFVGYVFKSLEKAALGNVNREIEYVSDLH